MNSKITDYVSLALDKVCKKTGKGEDCFSEFAPQIPDTFVPKKDVAVYGRCLDGDLCGKTIRDLANEGNHFAGMVVLLTQMFGKYWDKHVIYGNVAIISDYNGGHNLGDRLSKKMFDAQYSEICSVFKEVQEQYRPYITFLFTGNTACDSIYDRIDFNEPLFVYYDAVGYEEIDRHVWKETEGGKKYSITLFKCHDNRFFLELDVPCTSLPNEEYAEAILTMLKKNMVI